MLKKICMISSDIKSPEETGVKTGPFQHVQINCESSSAMMLSQEYAQGRQLEKMLVRFMGFGNVNYDEVVSQPVVLLLNIMIRLKITFTSRTA